MYYDYVCVFRCSEKTTDLTDKTCSLPEKTVETGDLADKAASVLGVIGLAGDGVAS